MYGPGGAINGVLVGVGIGVLVGVDIGVLVGVLVTVGVGVFVGVGDNPGVIVGVGVGVGDIGHGLAAIQGTQLGYTVWPFHTTLIGPDCWFKMV